MLQEDKRDLKQKSKKSNQKGIYMDKTIIDTDKTQFENKNNIIKVDNEIIYDQSTFNKIDIFIIFKSNIFTI